MKSPPRSWFSYNITAVSYTHLDVYKRQVEALLEEDFVAFYGRIDEVCRELPSCFIRIHNRYIVNLNYVTTLEKDRCILGSRSFPVSRAFRQELETAFARAMLK